MARGVYSDDEDSRRIYLVSAALSPEEYRIYPKWFAELVPSGHLTLTLDDMLVFADRFGIDEQDKWKIFDVFESPLSTLEKGEFYAFVRLIGHVMNGKTPSSELVFQQAPVPKIIHASATPVPSAPIPMQTATQSPLSSLTLNIPSPVQTTGSSATSPMDGTRANPFRRNQEKEANASTNRSSFESRVSFESRGSIESITKSRGDESKSDSQAVDAFKQMLLAGNSEPPVSVPVPPPVVEFNPLPVSVDTPPITEDAVFQLSDGTSSDDDDSVHDEDDTEEFSDSKQVDEDSVNGLGISKSMLPKIHTIHSQHYLVMPQSAEPVSSEVAKPSEPDHTKRAPPPPPPRKGHAAPANTSSSQASGESVQDVTAEELATRRADSLSPPARPDNKTKQASPPVSSPLGAATAVAPEATKAIPGPARDIDFDAAFEQPLYDAISSPRLNESIPVASPPTQAVSASPPAAPAAAQTSQIVSPPVQAPVKAAVPPPPPPSRRKVGVAKETNLTGPSRHSHPPPPPPPPPPATHGVHNSKVELEKDQVPDLLADLSALQKEIDALRAAQSEDGV